MLLQSQKRSFKLNFPDIVTLTYFTFRYGGILKFIFNFLAIYTDIHKFVFPFLPPSYSCIYISNR